MRVRLFVSFDCLLRTLKGAASRAQGHFLHYLVPELIVCWLLQDRELSPYNKQQHSYYERLRLDDFGDGEDGELTWFTAGVRVGVGLGLGLMLGVGIGVGLMVKTYHTTTRTLKRGLF